MNGRKTKQLRKEFAKTYDVKFLGEKLYRNHWRKTKREHVRGVA